MKRRGGFSLIEVVVFIGVLSLFFVAAAAIKHNTYLLAADKDFVHIAAVSPLKLL